MPGPTCSKCGGPVTGADVFRTPRLCASCREQFNPEALQRELRRQELDRKYSTRPTSPNSQEVIEYTSYNDFEDDRGEWLARGWKVASISDTPQRAGFGRVVALGFVGALAIKPESHVFVVYERATEVESEKPSQPAATTSTGSPNPTPTVSLSAELERLASLYNAGNLTAEEFDRAKQRLLNG